MHDTLRRMIRAQLGGGDNHHPEVVLCCGVRCCASDSECERECADDDDDDESDGSDVQWESGSDTGETTEEEDDDDDEDEERSVLNILCVSGSTDCCLADAARESAEEACAWAEGDPFPPLPGEWISTQLAETRERTSALVADCKDLNQRVNDMAALDSVRHAVLVAGLCGLSVARAVGHKTECMFLMMYVLFHLMFVLLWVFVWTCEGFNPLTSWVCRMFMKCGLFFPASAEHVRYATFDRS